MFILIQQNVESSNNVFGGNHSSRRSTYAVQKFLFWLTNLYQFPFSGDTLGQHHFFTWQRTPSSKHLSRHSGLHFPNRYMWSHNLWRPYNCQTLMFCIWDEDLFVQPADNVTNFFKILFCLHYCLHLIVITTESILINLCSAIDHNEDGSMYILQ